MKAGARSRRHASVHRRSAPRRGHGRDERPFFPGKDKSKSQSKLTVSRPGDRQEREAEATADRITGQMGVAFFPGPGKTGRTGPEIGEPGISPEAEAASVQQLQGMQAARTEDKVGREQARRKAGEEEEPVQAKTEPEQDQAQKQAEEEPVQAKVEPGQDQVQKQAEEDEPVQAQAEPGQDQAQMEAEEEPVQAAAEPEQDQAQMQAEEEEPVQATAASGQDQAQKQAETEEETVQRQAMVPAQANAELQSRLQLSKGKGEPLSAPLQARFGQAFGADFSQVRIHTGAEAAALCRDFGAQAFTNGRDIYFNQGRFAPDSAEGRHLLAHELTHSIQQGVAPLVAPRPDPEIRREVSEDLAAELRASEQEATQAIDPMPAEQARREAEQEGKQALEQAKEDVPEARPQELPPPPPVEGDAGRVAEPQTRAPDIVTPSPPAEDRGEAGTDLAEQSAGVCGEGAAKTQQLADNESAHEPAESKRGQSEAAVAPPVEEGASRSNAEQVTTMDEGADPATDPQAAKRALEQGVAEATPRSIEGLNEFKSKGKGKVVGNEVAASVTADVNKVKGTYSTIETPPPPAPAEQPKPMPAPELAPTTPPLDLGRDAVPKLAEEHTDFSQYESESDALLEKEGITQDQLDMVDSGELAEANKERKQLAKEVADQPAAMQQMAKEEAKQVDQEMAREEGKVREATKAKRAQDLNATATRQQAVKSELELKREAVARKVNGIYEAAKTRVTKKLETLETESLKRFEDGQAGFAVQFEDEVNRDIDNWKEERYSGLFAGVKWLKDKIVGIDHFPEVQRAFDLGRERFVQRLDRLMLDINRDNETVIRECKEELAKARKEIKEFVDGLGPELQDAGRKAQTDMEGKLKELDGFIDQKKKELQEKLCAAKEAAIEAIDKKIEEMKASMSGVVGKLGTLLLNAALKFFEWALKKAGLNPAGLMNTIRKGAAVIKSIVGDPIGFFKNLAAAVGAGIKGFVTRIKKYLIQGLVEWLTGSLGEAGITLPAKFDLRGIFSLVLQILGLTWANIRQKLVKKLGEKVVAGLEKTSEVVKRILVDGPIALWEMVKEKAAEIKQKVMEGIRNWVIANVVKQAMIKLVSMLNPAGAIVQAIIAIYNVVMFFVENISRIIDFAKSIINSIAKIASGAISSAAAFIEKAMGRTVPIILAFLARLIGLGGIGKAIKKIIGTVRKPVDKVLDRIVGFLAKMAKKVVGKVKGVSKKVVAKLVGWWSKRTKFKAGGESHSLFFKANKPEGAVMVASEEKTLEKFLKENKPEGTEGKLAATYGQAVAQMTEVERERKELRKVLRDDKANAAQKAQADKSLQAWNGLKIKLAAFMDQLKGASTHKETQIKYAGGLKHGQIGKGATAFPLTIKGASGSTPSVENEIWNKVKLRRKGNGTFYIRGHLINDNLHGPGSSNENLTPITGDANKDHNRNVEEPVKDVVWNRDKKNPEGKAVRYQVTADYGNHAVSADAVKAKIAQETQDADRRKSLESIVDAEQKLPTALQCKAEVVEREGEGYSAKGKAFIEGGKGNIPNKIPDTVPELAGTPPKVLLRLSLSDPGSESHLRMLPGIDGKRAQAIIQARTMDAEGNALDSPKAFRSWDEFQARAQGIGTGIISALKDYKFRGKRVVYLSGTTKLVD